MDSTFIYKQGSLNREISLLPLNSQELGSLLPTLWGGPVQATPGSGRWWEKEESSHTIPEARQYAQEILCAPGGKIELLGISGLQVSLTRLSPPGTRTRLQKSQPGQAGVSPSWRQSWSLGFTFTVDQHSDPAAFLALTLQLPSIL